MSNQKKVIETHPIIESQFNHRPGDFRLLKIFENYDIISFDVFDTAVLRSVEEPRDIFRIMSLEMNYDLFYDARVAAEKEARLKKKGKCGSEEVTLKEIYTILHELNDVDYCWMNREIELEIEISRVNPYFKNLFDKLISTNKTVIFTSDMYLPKETIQQILQNAGYFGYDGLYISSELNFSKKTGSLQEYIKNIYGINKKYYHIGDNYRADIKNSKIHNFGTYMYHSVKELAKEYKPSNSIELSSSIYNGIVSNNLLNGMWKHTIYYEHGFKVGGILAAGYCRFLNKIVVDKKIDKILFCARDCDVIYKIYNKFYKLVPNDYFFVSRYALMNVAPRRYFDDLFNRVAASSKNNGTTVQTFLKRLGVSYLTDYCESHGVNINEYIGERNTERLKVLLSENLDQIEAHNKNQIDAAKLYFSRRINNCKNVLIVDIGWSGSCISVVNYFINKYITNKCNIYGALMFSNNSPQFSSISSEFISAYIVAPGHNEDLYCVQHPANKNIAHNNNQMLEYLFTSRDSSLISYKIDENNEVQFIKSNKQCKNPSEIYEMHEGMFDFVNQFESVCKIIKKSIEISPYVAYAPFAKSINSIDYCYEIYKNFAYEPTVFQGKIDQYVPFGRHLKTNSRKILLITHSFSYTGAPHSLLRICKILLDLNYTCEVWSPVDGGMKNNFINYGANVRIIPAIELYKSKNIKLISEFYCAIVNTVLAGDYYILISKYIPTIWYIREATNIEEFCNNSIHRDVFSSLKHSKDVYCVSSYAANYLKRYNSQIKIVHNCVEDMSQYALNEKHDKIRFIQLGTFEKRKAFDILIQAYLLLDPSYQNQCEIWMAGQLLDKHYIYYSELLKIINNCSGLKYLGEIKDEIIKIETISRSDVVVISSLDESCSLVALEGAMLSKPLIVTENVGAKYLVDKSNGIIIKTGDPNSLKNAIIQMIDNKNNLQKLGKNSRNHYNNLASMETHRNDIDALITDTVNRYNSKDLKEYWSRSVRANIFVRQFQRFLGLLCMFKNGNMKELLSYAYYSSQILAKYPNLKSIIRDAYSVFELKNTQKNKKHNIIVSLTSYPKRINTVSNVIQTILKQSLKADKIILYLAEDQFPNKEMDLPKKLLALTKYGLNIKWCDDLKSHKKYYYSIREYPTSIIITMDDDVLYDKYTIAKLYNSYLKHPNCISCLRAHSITLNQYGLINPYSEWIWEDKKLLDNPSILGVATGCAGVLYPPNILPQDTFDKEELINRALPVDDLWLKIMELRNGVPVVLAYPTQELHFVEGSQESAISLKNVQGGDNDYYLKKILEKYADYNGINVFSQINKYIVRKAN